ncbi:MAG: hypothetical protein ACO3EZ_02930 [Prochlorotrichaceae cyanobacterium]
MLYLARVYSYPGEPGVRLHLLAQKQSEFLWDVLDTEETLNLSAIPPELGSLVLVEVNNRLVIRLEDATHWVTELIGQYLSQGISPEFLEKEGERAEKSRQEITLQLQDLERRQLELEARACQSK